MDNLEAKLIIEKSDIVFRCLLSLGVSWQIAEDLVGEAIYKASLYFEGIEPEKLKAWLFQVALNAYYDLLRKNSKQFLCKNVDLDKIYQGVMYQQSCLVEEEILQEELGERIARTLAKMNCTYQEVLLLKVQLDLSYREISEYLDMPVDTVRTYLHRARKKFKKTWEEENDE